MIFSYLSGVNENKFGLNKTPEVIWWKSEIRVVEPALPKIRPLLFIQELFKYCI